MPGKTPVRLFGLLTVLLMSPAFAATEEIDTGPILLVPMAEGIYAVEPKFAGASGTLILNDTGNIVIDTHGTPASARALIDAVQQLSDQPIRYVINTHWHVDHNSGNEAYKAVYGDGVVFVSHHDTRIDMPTLGARQFEDTAPYRVYPVQAANDALAANSDSHDRPLTKEQIENINEFRDAQAEFAARDDFDFTLPTLTYEKSVTLHGHPYTAEIFYLFPAHTKSDSIIYLREQEILIIGDLLTKPILWSWSSYPSSYVKTLKELEQLPAKQIVIGHGGPILHNKDYLILVRQFLELIVSYTETSLSNGLGEDAAIEAAANHTDIQAFRRRFVTAEEDGMFDQMVGWTIARSYLEQSDD